MRRDDCGAAYSRPQSRGRLTRERSRQDQPCTVLCVPAYLFYLIQNDWKGKKNIYKEYLCHCETACVQVEVNEKYFKKLGKIFETWEYCTWAAVVSSGDGWQQSALCLAPRPRQPPLSCYTQIVVLVKIEIDWKMIRALLLPWRRRRAVTVSFIGIHSSIFLLLILLKDLNCFKAYNNKI